MLIHRSRSEPVSDPASTGPQMVCGAAGQLVVQRGRNGMFFRAIECRGSQGRPDRHPEIEA